MKILIVEDNPGDALLIRENLLEGFAGKDIDISVVDRLSKAVKKLNETAFDVVLLDLGHHPAVLERDGDRAFEPPGAGKRRIRVKPDAPRQRQDGRIVQVRLAVSALAERPAIERLRERVLQADAAVRV